jgi:hypothetical protein
MLDLDAIFNPDETMAVRQAVPVPAPVTTPGIDPDHLPGDWRVDWEERAAVLEYDGGHPRKRAEALALREIICQMRTAGAVCRKPGG